jgi:predicted  nucleic acid-binding Zn-ribbon protein
MEEKTRNLYNDLHSAKQLLMEKQADIDKVRSEVITLTSKANDKDEKLQEMHIELNKNQEEINRLHKHIEMYKEQVRGQSEEVCTTQLENDRLCAETSRLEDSVTELEDSVTELQDHVTDLQDHKTQLQDRVTKLESDVSSRDRQIAEQVASGDELWSKIREQVEQIDRLTREHTASKQVNKYFTNNRCLLHTFYTYNTT